MTNEKANEIFKKALSTSAKDFSNGTTTFDVACNANKLIKPELITKGAINPLLKKMSRAALESIIEAQYPLWSGLAQIELNKVYA